MAIVSVMYDAKPGSRFDLAYYLQTHMKLVEATWTQVGLRGYTVLKGTTAPSGGDPMFQIVANLDFSSSSAFETAVALHGAAIMGDIPNFTDIQPTIQISEVAGTYAGGG